MKRSQKTGALLLAAASVLWGSTFVAQSVGMRYMGPYTYIFARNVVGVAVLLVFLAVTGRLREKAENPKALWLGGFLIGTALFAASAFQQTGMLTTSVGKSGFLTALYLVLVPVFGLVLGRRVTRRVGLSIALAVLGMYFMCITREDLYISSGDVFMLLCAAVFSVQIMLVSHYGRLTDGVKLSCLEFFFCAAEAGVFMLLFEQPRMQNVLAGWLPVLYAGVISNGIAYTFQILGQRSVPDAVASILMSMESVFALLAGWVVLHQMLSPRELGGAALIFAAVLLSQLPEKHAKETAARAAAAAGSAPAGKV